MRSERAKRPLGRQLGWMLAGVAAVTGIAAGWVCFVLSTDYIADRAVAVESRFMIERGRRADRPFARVSDAHATANAEYEDLLAGLTDAEVEATFADAFELRPDGTTRLSDRYYEGTTLSGRHYESFAAFVAPGEVTLDRKRRMVAALEAIRTAAAAFEGKVESIALALPDNDMVVFAPDRPDRLSYYRYDAPSDFAVWGYVVESLDPSGRTVCEGPVQVGWDPTGRSLAASCQTAIIEGDEIVGAWDTTLALNSRLLSLLETEAEVASSLVATTDGTVIVAPELGFSATATPEQIEHLGRLYPVATLTDELEAQEEGAGAFVSADGRWIVRYHHFTGPDWVLIDLIERRTIMMSLLRAPLFVTLLLLGSLLAQAFLVGLFIRRRFIRPLGDIAAVFGRPVDEQRLDDPKLVMACQKPDEIGILAGTLVAAKRDHDALIETLEERVRERTEKYKAASKAKSDFLANMSHEIRTPMNGILGMAELLSQTEMTERQQLFADTIFKSGNALLTVINDVLDFSKIDAGRLELDPHPFDLREAVEDVATLLTTTAQDKGVEIVVRCDPNLPASLIGDGGRIRRIVTNLTGNAVKFTPEGYVKIDVRKARGSESRWRIEVRDTGIGIPEDKLETIFEEFAQAEESTTRIYGGTGLGLTICRRLAEMMGGRIGVDSTLGAGSTFWVELPLPVADDTGTAPIGMQQLPTARVLLVDDVDVNLDILEEQCRSWGLLPTRAAGGREAIELLDRTATDGHPFEAVVLDYHMPEVDGLDVARHIAQSEMLSMTKVVVLSSADDDASIAAFREIGTEGYLVKPVRALQLYRALTNAFARSNPALEAVAAPVGTPPAMPDEAGAMLRILVVDDNAVNRLVFGNLLGEGRYAVSYAEDGQEAYEAYKADRFDIVLMDLSMPRMDGYEATAAIRALEHKENRPRTPVVCLTAHALQGQRDECLAHGMDDYLSKPIRKDALQTILTRWAGGDDTGKDEVASA
ncbi:response regulator [Parvularcula dongshanensis]|uniref:histidine kinase n=1 Tax=Parvularcula dongshanensis TaxID=1173995 RepID=A0A840I6F6_9PROT|nr:response regulator [Parvularcula dongshanensis]MBB4659764.1 signal transduction histidine kinase/DNA-binding response OmpR family regulator [Parvularcula dongshanensis]